MATSKKTIKPTANKRAGVYINTRQPFYGSNLHANYVTSSVHTGRLSDEHAVDLHKAIERTTPGHPVFVVYSYSTPIAWWDEHNGWTVPAVKYSVTTSKHQSIVRRAI